MRTLKLSAIFIMAAYFVACSPVKFEKAAEKEESFCGANGVACVTQCKDADCFTEYKISKTTGQQEVDILVVNDNSGSMSPEQSKMALRFPTFIQSLGSLSYRIGMTTTDITDGMAISKGGSWNSLTPQPNRLSGTTTYRGETAQIIQDGNLIPFGNGKKFLERDNSISASTANTYFANAAERKETLKCEESNYTTCPSNDERGVFAATLAIERNEFMRPLAHLAIVILSDEDERGLSNPASGSVGKYQRETYDLPATLISKMKSKFPGKSLSVHPIIVRPGDSGCLAAQADPSKNIRGVEGHTYQELFSLAGGTMGSICANDYGTTLADIGSYVQKESVSLPFQCRPANDQYKVVFTPQPAGNVNVEEDFSKMTLKVTDTLPPGTTVTLEYKCKK